MADALDLMTVDELAAILRLQRHTILNWRSSGQWPAELPAGFKVGRFVYWRRDAVVEALAVAAEAGQ